jgi:PKHD-type hydroxylase
MGALQLTRYQPRQHFNWHMDLGPGPMSRRKISLVAELGGKYTGGGIEVFYGGANRVPLARGDVLLFPSFIMHRALPVTSGERWSLVAWLLGDTPFC